MLVKLLKTEDTLILLVLRVTLGIVIFAHGAQKLFGIWGGHGVNWTVEAWAQWWNMPSIITYLVIIVESIGAICLILGFASRIWAFLIGMVMVGAIYLVHLRWGFYMNWYMQPQTGEGFEYHILVLSMVAVIVIGGAGKWSIDSEILKKLSVI